MLLLLHIKNWLKLMSTNSTKTEYLMISLVYLVASENIQTSSSFAHFIMLLFSF